MTMVMGHPLVATPTTLASAFGLYAAWQHGDAIVALVAAAVLAKLATTIDEARAYRAWMRKWQAMDPDAPRQRRHWHARLVGLVVGAGLAVAFVLDPSGIEAVGRALGLGVAGIAMLAVLWSAIRRAKRCRPARSFLVKVVARPLLPVPSVTDAYRALPGYCHALMARRT